MSFTALARIPDSGSITISTQDLIKIMNKFKSFPLTGEKGRFTVDADHDIAATPTGVTMVNRETFDKAIAKLKPSASGLEVYNFSLTNTSHAKMLFERTPYLATLLTETINKIHQRKIEALKNKIVKILDSYSVSFGRLFSGGRTKMTLREELKLRLTGATITSISALRAELETWSKESSNRDSRKSKREAFVVRRFEKGKPSTGSDTLRRINTATEQAFM